MGGGKGGGGGSSSSTYQPPPDEVNIQTTGWGGMGPTQVPQTFTQQGMPNWMRANNAPQQQGYVQGQPNWFGADWWGRSAANPNQMLTQKDLMYQQPIRAPAQSQDMQNGQGRPPPFQQRFLMSAFGDAGPASAYVAGRSRAGIPSYSALPGAFFSGG